jgi:hypothetical protein
MQAKPAVATPLFAATGPGEPSLPIIDVSNPAFAVHVSDDELARLYADYQREAEQRAKLPGWVQRLFWRVFLRKSVLAQSLRSAEGGFLDGMSTYRLKLGPNNLDPSWADPMDRKIAASLPCLSMRLRLQDMAELLADNLEPRLAAHPGRPLHLVNIAGGPSMDSLNTLLLLRKRDPAHLEDRPAGINLYDQDNAGPAFAKRALASLKEPGAPLADLNITLTHTPYQWADTRRLHEGLLHLPPDAIIAASSEGGLFDYGSDEEIVANLEVLRDCLPTDTTIAGSLTRVDESSQHRKLRMRFKTRPRELPGFGALVGKTGWLVERSRTRPFHYSVLLKRS